MQDIITFARIYTQYGITGQEGIIKSFGDALYFSVVTWTTLGYGDFTPTQESRGWAATEAFLGYIFMGILVALVLHFLGNSKPKEFSK